MTAERGSACQAGEPGRRVAAAVRAPRRELPRGDIEDGGQPLDFPGGETPLLAVAAAFGGAYGGGVLPAHQFAELRLTPPLALAQGPDVHADDGRLPFPVTGAPGWQITTRSRHLAVAVATTLPGGTVHSHEKGEWQPRLPEAVLKVVATRGDADTLLCRLIIQADLGVFTLAFAPWPAALVLRCPLTALPAQRRHRCAMCG